MKRFSEQLKKKSLTIRLSAAEKRDVRERLVAFMEYHPLAVTHKKLAPVVSETAPYRLISIPVQYIRLGLGVMAVFVLIVLPTMADEGSRIHTTFNQALTATGRLSSTNPNLQNIPIRTEKGREVRKAFIARNDEFTILSADYSQIELRIIAELSEDPGMMEAFEKGLDIHAATASKVFNVPLEAVDKEMRRKAKAVNFGISYGQTAFGLSQTLNIPRKEAQDIIENYFAQYPNVRLLMDKNIAFAREHGYVETIMGRRRYLRDINDSNNNVRSGAERNAINAPIQGSAADMIKIAMINIHHAIKEKNLRSRLLLQVHDELVFDAHKDEVEILKPLIREGMRNAIPMKVAIEVDMGTGKNWLEAH